MEAAPSGTHGLYLGKEENGELCLRADQSSGSQKCQGLKKVYLSVCVPVCAYVCEYMCLRVRKEQNKLAG